MKYLFAILAMGLVMLGSFAASITGIVFMVSDLVTHNGNFFQGFQIFALGTILLMATIAAYTQAQILNNTKIIGEALAEYMTHQMNKEQAGGGLPNLASILGGGFPMHGMLKMSRMDENGNIVPFMEKEFNSPEEFIKYRNEILTKAFGFKPEETEKKLEEMSIEELKLKEKEASDNQKFELAAMIRDLISKKSKK
jgi:hypothetical protein